MKKSIPQATKQALQRAAATSFPALFAMAAVVGASPANAVFVTASGVDAETRHYAIAAGSTVSYDPGGFIFGGAAGLSGVPAGTYDISGKFDAVFSRYWWTYHLDGDPLGNNGTFVWESRWLQFVNPNVVGNIAPGGFEFPAFFVSVNGGQLYGNAGACNFPLGPDTYCSGFDLLPIASLSGEWVGSQMILDGFQPTGGFYEGFSYHVVALQVPQPPTAWLLVLGVGLLGFSLRDRFSPDESGYQGAVRDLFATTVTRFIERSVCRT
ncbi:MAG: PEP-CTERM sorting domain-containing protein [Candidatus Accumulibacter sp. UW27]|jgi:hypothetical protein